MSKAVLIMDMPERCDKCPCMKTLGNGAYCTKDMENYRYIDFAVRELGIYKPDWCPLIPAPDHYQLEYWEKDAYKGGWNDALDQIGLYERPHYLDALEGKT